MFNDNKKIILPETPFLYTLDQIATLTGLTMTTLRERYIWFEHRSTGVKRTKLMLAHNINGPEDKPEWRVSEREFVRWLRACGFRTTLRGWE